ncbi:hypothetical protein BO78DRAFT_419971 [Aspergillus sclerotiicarbonarius CBS 121057]|uniref:Aldehyde dehydrogenase domain-containing protein n=1 Tax=Aspergillus sclerotiicarbonarius (strain CBS 121057 / IBT 28362) TaxID=1448318 RepID=A0A319E4Z0_ASPSB|nr:hypothetical protein BO78DRAFT_419971 [Aspergillus sclerotiicarbonarius CBS 121057]
MWSSGSHLKRVSAAATDGRTSNVRYIQSELKVLYQSILDSRERVLEVIASNTSTTEIEAEVEFSLAIAEVRQHYDEINFDQAIANEYKIARGENNPGRWVGHGVVVVRPITHTRFYAVISAVACAIAAGNTFIVECDKDPVDDLFPALFQPLDWELYALVQGPITNHDILSTALIVDQTGTTDSPDSVISSPNLRSIAVLDRTADVEKAATQILSAHLAFSGQSPHAPDLIVVNEWVKQKLIDTIIRERQRIGRKIRSSHSDDLQWKIPVTEAESRGEAKLIKTEGLYMIDVHDKSSPLVAQRGGGRYLTLLKVSSLADAVLTLTQTPEYLVAYHFADPAAGKFLSQQINSHWSFINHIPVQLLVGPALPLKQGPFSPNLRYTKEMLSKLRPEVILPDQGSIVGLEDLHNPTSSKLQLLRQRETQPLREMGQGPGTAIGFFEQGIILGALVIVLPVVSVVGYSGWIFGRKVLFTFAWRLAGL